MEKNGSYGFASGLVLGGTLGAIAALLFAPRPGRETRADLATRAGHLVARGEAAIEKAREAARETSDGVKRAARILREGEGRVEDGALSPPPALSSPPPGTL